MFLKHGDKKRKNISFGVEVIVISRQSIYFVFFIFSFEENLENLNEL